MKRFVSERNVEFADCDSARIVFYPNFYIWFDRATERLFASVGLTYQVMELRHGVIGLPLLETGARYLRPCRHGERVRLESWVDSWREKVFVVKHRIECEGEFAVEGYETRAWAAPAAEGRRSMRAVPIPDSVRELFQ
ncbi:MAG: thioesterase family protein [Deltaproteobacteria bacterium]|nr:thioesterase family protein [Deltaproteobacteria bacterium]